jgi:hypothetical protein
MTHHDTPAPATRRFRVSYGFVDTVAGDEDAIRKALRDVSFSRAFDPDDLDRWRVTRDADGRYLLAAWRTLVDEIRRPPGGPRSGASCTTSTCPTTSTSPASASRRSPSPDDDDDPVPG